MQKSLSCQDRRAKSSGTWHLDLVTVGQRSEVDKEVRHLASTAAVETCAAVQQYLEDQGTEQCRGLNN